MWETYTSCRRPTAEMTQLWRELLSQHRKMTWLEYALKSAENEYVKAMLVSSTLGSVGFDVISEYIKGETPACGADWAGQRRERVLFLLEQATSVARINKPQVSVQRARAQRMRTKRIVWAVRRNEELRPPCAVETAYNECLEFNDALRYTIKAYDGCRRGMQP